MLTCKGNGAERKVDNMDIETKPNKKVDVADVTTVSLRDMYMRLCACRDFEIKLQWERAVFLTAFLIACFAGYGSFLLSVHEHGYGSLSSLVIKCIPIVITFAGIVLSLLWILMAKGSKAWYEHYEQAISAFAKKYSGDVHEYMMSHRWCDMLEQNRNVMSDGVVNFKGGAYSVSKIVIAIGICSLMSWCSLFILHCAIAVWGPISMWRIFNCAHLYEAIIFLFSISLFLVMKILTKKCGSGYLKICDMFLGKPQRLILKREKRFFGVFSISKAVNWIKDNKSDSSHWYLLIGKDRNACFDGDGNEKTLKDITALDKDFSVVLKKLPSIGMFQMLYSFEVTIK